MAKIAVWEFGENAVFDGAKLFAEVTPELTKTLRSGTVELSFVANRLVRSTLFAQGVPGRDPGAFTFVLTHAGAVSLSCTDGRGAPYRIRTPDGFADCGEQVQVTLSWGTRARFTVVNCDRKHRDPHDPAGGFTASLPLRARIDLRETHSFTFGAAAGGIAPFFNGRITAASLADTADKPTVAPPTAQIIRPDFARKTMVQPHRIVADFDHAGPRRTGQELHAQPRKGTRGLRITTSEGEKPLSRLEVGDEVLTRTDGLQRVSWVGRVDLEWRTLNETPALQPVVIRKGSLGGGLPEADLALPPWQRLMIAKADHASAYGAENVLVSARHLEGAGGHPTTEAIGVSYVHFFCRNHTLAQINGVWVEAFHPGRAATGAGADTRRSEILALFPELREHAQPVRS